MTDEKMIEADEEVDEKEFKLSAEQEKKLQRLVSKEIENRKQLEKAMQPMLENIVRFIKQVQPALDIFTEATKAIQPINELISYNKFSANPPYLPEYVKITPLPKSQCPHCGENL